MNKILLGIGFLFLIISTNKKEPDIEIPAGSRFGETREGTGVVNVSI